MGDLRCSLLHLETKLSTHRRRRRNVTELLKGSDNQWTSNVDTTAQAFLTHFTRLYSSSHPDHDHTFTSPFQPTISDEGSNILCATPDVLETQRAILALGPRESPGPDGMSAIFYQRYWTIVGEDINKAVHSFFEGNFLLKKPMTILP